MALMEETRLRLMALARSEILHIDKEIQQIGELRKSAKLPDNTLKYFTTKEDQLRLVSAELRGFIKEIVAQ